MVDGPEYKDTKQIPKVEVPGNTLTAVLQEVRAMRADFDLVIGDVRGMKSDIRELQRWRGSEEERQTKHSGGIREISNVNLKQDSQLAQLTTDLAEVKHQVVINTAETLALRVETRNQTAILDRIETAGKAFFSNPFVRTLLTAAGAAIATWLAGKGH